MFAEVFGLPLPLGFRFNWSIPNNRKNVKNTCPSLGDFPVYDVWNLLSKARGARARLTGSRLKV